MKSSPVRKRVSACGACLALLLSVSLFLVAQKQPVELHSDVTLPFRFVAYGDTRFTDPSNTEAANPTMRKMLVQAIADVHPAFISIGGDIAYRGDHAEDWKVWDAETAVWRERNIPVYPALGNHDLHGKKKIALRNYFRRFPELKHSRYYSVRAGNALMLVLDSSLEEMHGPQGQWLTSQLNAIRPAVDFVFLVLHHPPYTSSSDEKRYGGGHSARHTEQALAGMLEQRQRRTRARFIVFAGHVHNYERHEHNGVTYFVTGGGGAHAYPIERSADDLFRSKEVNYHYLLVEDTGRKLTVTMNRLDVTTGKPVWTQPDSVTIVAPNATPAGAGAR